MLPLKEKTKDFFIILALCFGSAFLTRFFCHLLNEVLLWAPNHRWSILLLPVAAALINWISRHLQQRKEETSIQYYLPYTILSALLSHSVGGSVGREMVAVQIGKYWSYLFKKQSVFFKKISVSSAFGIMFQNPLSGALYSEETSQKKSLLHFIFIFLIVTVANHLFSVFWPDQNLFNEISSFVDTQNMDSRAMLQISFLLFLVTLLCSSLALSLAHIGAEKILLHFTTRSAVIKYGLSIFIAIVLYVTDGLYANTGSNLLITTPAFSLIAIKVLITVACLVVGLRGGEFVPLALSGGLLGSLIANYFSLPIVLGFTLGLFLLVNHRLRLPWTLAALLMPGFSIVTDGKLTLIAFILLHVGSYLMGPLEIWALQRLEHINLHQRRQGT